MNTTREPQWTAQPPVSPGYYWLRTDICPVPEIVRVSFADAAGAMGGSVDQFGSRGPIAIRRLYELVRPEWMGPIPERPVEPSPTDKPIPRNEQPGAFWED